MVPEFRQFLADNARLILIRIDDVKGSSPREAGTMMLVGRQILWGTIGGGQFEYLAIDQARQMLNSGESIKHLDIALGPDIGQCCGGRCLISLHYVSDDLRQQLLGEQHLRLSQQPNLYIFGSGHVGKALANAFHLLPVNLTVVESREAEFEGLNTAISRRLSAMPEAFARAIPSGSAVIITTHDHAQDFLIAAECLGRDDLVYIGMIGSATKRASFKHYLQRETDLPACAEQRLVLPIGGKQLNDKRPEMIAAMVVPEVLLALQSHREKAIHTPADPTPHTAV